MALKAPFKPTDDDDVFAFNAKTKLGAFTLDGLDGDNTVLVEDSLNLGVVSAFDNIQHFNIASGKSLTLTGSQVEHIAIAATEAEATWDINGVVDAIGTGYTDAHTERTETLVIKLAKNQTLDLSTDSNNSNPFNDLVVKVQGSTGAESFTGTDNAEWIYGLGGADNLSGNGGNDVIDGGAGNDTVSGDDGDDILLGGAGADTLNGGEGDDTLNGGGGDDALNGGDGNDTLKVGVGADIFNGDAGSDTFVINTRSVDDITIDGGTNNEDSLGRVGTAVPATPSTSVDVSKAYATDGVISPSFYTGTSVSTVDSTLSYNAVDTIQFNRSGDFSNIEFSHIEKISLASGVSITLSGEQLDGAIASLDLGALNPGLHFYGVAGGKTETVTVVVDYADTTFDATSIGGTATTYSTGDFQLDDASIGNLFHDVVHKDDFNTNSVTASYARADGSNSNDWGNGSKGVDNVTLRLGNDVYFGNEGNDLLIGHQGADYLDGGAGNDFFTVTGFATGVHGASSKADDGTAEWINGASSTNAGANGDVIIGGDGTDTFRITSGALNSTDGKITFTDNNFKSMEKVEIGTTITVANSEDAYLRMANDHYYLNAGKTESTGTGLKAGQSFNNVSVDASGVTANGLIFEGNGNVNTFIGTTQADTFTGNGGNDVLTGKGGADIFIFGNVITKTATDADGAGPNTVQDYQDVATSLTGIDTITDFTSGTDKIYLNDDFFTVFNATTATTIDAANLVQGAGVTASAGTTDYLIFDSTSKALYYDADANGAGAAVQIASLTGVSTLAAGDFLII
jgi:Ca2+-binding RTX toxin-like protein